MPDRNLATRGVALLALVTTLTILLAGCDRQVSSQREINVASDSTTAVEVIRAQPKSVRRVVEQPGAIFPYEETHLYARVPGYIGKIHCDIGQKVEPGEVLAELTVPELVEEANQKKALVRQAEADEDQAKKALASAEANIASTEAAVVEARAGAERWGSESRRIGKMVQSGVIDPQTRDETSNQYKAAGARVLATEAAVRKAKADRDKAKADVHSAEARVNVARAEARRLEALLGYAKIRAPFAGVVTRRNANTGDLVSPVPGKGDWLFTVSRLDPVRVVIDVPEADAGLVEEKSEANLSIPALRTPAITAKVTRTSWSLTPGARTLRAEIDLPNKDGKLRPGMYVYARVSGEQTAAWTLPVSALVKQGDMMVCFLIENGKAVRTPVQTGRSDGKVTEVLKYQRAGSTTWTDWTGKEEVAAKAAGLTDGQEVSVQRPEA